MQDPNADTEWNDVLRSKGILPPKETEVSEEDIVNILEQTVQQKSQGKGFEDMTLNELDELEDDITEEDDRAFEEYRRQRMADFQSIQKCSRYGDVREISKQDYITEVNNAGEGIWVVLHVYKNSIPLCKLINQHLQTLARKFPATKFLNSVSSVCIPNYPDKNLPTIFVYYEGDMKKQMVGPHAFGGMNLTQDYLEWVLSEVGAVKTTLESNPRQEVRDVLSENIRTMNQDDSDSDY